MQINPDNLRDAIKGTAVKIIAGLETGEMVPFSTADAEVCLMALAWLDHTAETASKKEESHKPSFGFVDFNNNTTKH